MPFVLFVSEQRNVVPALEVKLMPVQIADSLCKETFILCIPNVLISNTSAGTNILTVVINNVTCISDLRRGLD
jgi:hypothetical protein